MLITKHLIKKACILLVCVMMCAGLTACAGSSTDFYGDWSIDGVLSDAPMGDFNQEDLSTISSVPLTFSDTEATCFGDQIDSLGQTVSNPEYITIDISKDDFESMTGTSFDTLGIKGNKITQVSVINDPSYNDGIVFYVVNEDTLLANSLGTFFVLSRVN